MKKWHRMLAIVIFLFAFLVAGKNFFARVMIIKSVKAMTGVGLKLGSIRVNLFSQFFRLSDLEILNPPSFKEELMADFPEIYAAFDLWGFSRGNIHLRELKIYLKEFFVVINEDGSVNVKSLKAFLPKGKGKPPKLQIDSLDLKIDKVFLRNYSSGSPVEREFKLNINENIKNIENSDALVKLILLRVLSKTSIPSLAKIDLSDLKKEILNEIDKKIEAVSQELKNILPKKGELK